MNKYRTIIGLALGICIAATTTPALAEVQQGWYVGLSPGQSEYDISKDELDALVIDAFIEAGAPISGGDSSLDDNDTSWSVFGGYRFNPFIAVEAGYLDLGTAEYRANGTADPFGPFAPFPANFNADFESKGFTVAGVVSTPLGDMFDVHARLGILFADSEVTLSSAVGNGVRVSESVSGKSQDLFYGLGAALHFGVNWSVSLDWQQYKDVGKDDETGETDINALTIGVSYRL